MKLTINGEVIPLSDEDESCGNKLTILGCGLSLCTLGLSWVPMCVWCCIMNSKYKEEAAAAAAAPTTEVVPHHQRDNQGGNDDFHQNNNYGSGRRPSLDECMRGIDMGVVSSQVLTKMTTYGNPKHMHVIVGRIASTSSSRIDGGAKDGVATSAPGPNITSSTRVEVGPIYPTVVSQSPLSYALLVEDAKWLYPTTNTTNIDNDVIVAKLLSDRWGLLSSKLLGILRQSPMPPQRVAAMLHKAASSQSKPHVYSPVSNTVIAHPTSNIFSPIRWVVRVSLGPLFGHETHALLDAIEEEWRFFKGGPPSFWRVALPNGLVACPDPRAYDGLAEEDNAYYMALAETLRTGGPANN